MVHADGELSDFSQPKKVYSVLPKPRKGQWIVPLRRLKSEEIFKKYQEDKRNNGKVYHVLPRPRKGRWIVKLERLQAEKYF